MHPITAGIDAAAAAAILGALFGWLPYAAAALGLCWYSIQIWESRTCQHWWHNRQMVRKARKITKLRAREKVIVAKLEALEQVRAARHEAVEKVEKAKVEAAREVVQAETKLVEEGENTDQGL